MIPTPRIPSRCGQLLTTALVLWLPAVNSALAQPQGQGPDESAKAAPAESSPWADTASLEQFLTRTLTTHPEVVAAEAKVALAQAELRQTRFEAARELITFWNEWKAAEQEAAVVTEVYKRGEGSQQLVMAAKAKLSMLESQLRYLLGQADGFRSGSPSAFVPAGPKRAPEGPQVEKIIKALKEPTELEFVDTPLRDVVDTLHDYHKVPMTTDPVAADVPVTASIKDVVLAAALQMAEDVTPGIRFVVTDYGLLATSDTSAAAATYISANEFWRQHVEPAAPSASESQRPVAPQAKERGPTPAPDDPFAPGPPAAAANDPFAPGPPAAAKQPPTPAPRRGSDDPFAPGPARPKR